MGIHLEVEYHKDLNITQTRLWPETAWTDPRTEALSSDTAGAPHTHTVLQFPDSSDTHSQLTVPLGPRPRSQTTQSL